MMGTNLTPWMRKAERMDEDLLQILRKQVHVASSLLVVSHIRPDGDAVGSLLSADTEVLMGYTEQHGTHPSKRIEI